ncbi:MAG: hypothetical protein AAF559_01040 [Pseudomonadota bacterium]
MKVCSNCGGQGQIYAGETSGICLTCGGSGWVQERAAGGRPTGGSSGSGGMLQGLVVAAVIPLLIYLIYAFEVDLITAAIGAVIICVGVYGVIWFFLNLPGVGDILRFLGNLLFYGLMLFLAFVALRYMLGAG